MEKNVTKMHMREVIDGNTGEVVSTEKEYTFKVENEPAYFKVYAETVCVINGVGNSGANIFLAMMRHLTYEGSIVIVGHVREQLAKECGCTVGHVKNTIKKLVDKNILRNIGRSVYTVDPRIVGKGRWPEIKKLRSAWIKIEIESGRSTMTTSLGDKEERKLKKVS